MAAAAGVAEVAVPCIGAERSGAATALFVCDIQERFRTTITHYDDMIAMGAKMVDVARALSLPVVSTEHTYGVFGETVSELRTKLEAGDWPAPQLLGERKQQFAMTTPAVCEFMDKHDIKTVILVGIEAHICVLQTALALRERGIRVLVPLDAISSAHPAERPIAARTMERAGCLLTTTETLIFQLVQTAEHPQFKDMNNIIKTYFKQTRNALDALVLNSRSS
ncbi:hypothetical protein CXG81DRAFT_24733 [Caulochytrium protostelioides]|uniref:Isochorismatase-like domain-containing protein n=1 Tax=Caulochytrium protostelioides TaxID=1555241 RepID=A0A4P9XBV2_9FUNG|nr:hypothetical protein CXG81DRAFT_24733 [Caulochytrium protostelioides]|eukprot:RKP02591.1 hypothetical protein CXG81DRAFT_24733 [Caulochytrium protostelioides]